MFVFGSIRQEGGGFAEQTWFWNTVMLFILLNLYLAFLASQGPQGSQQIKAYIIKPRIKSNDKSKQLESELKYIAAAVVVH